MWNRYPKLLKAALFQLAAAPAVFGQCPMCRTAASAQGAAAARSLDCAILILLVPAVAMFTGVFLFAVRRQNPGEDTAETGNSGPATGSQNLDRGRRNPGEA